jgi:hypothetical protein
LQIIIILKKAETGRFSFSKRGFPRLALLEWNLPAGFSQAPSPSGERLSALRA